MRTRRLGRLVLALAASAAAGTTAPALATTYVNETFTNAQTIGNWIYGGGACLTAAPLNSAPAFTGSIPGCGTTSGTVGGSSGILPDKNGSGALRLTDNEGNQSGFVVYNGIVPGTSGLQATFTEYSYDTTTGSGADGISFAIIDAAAPGTPPTNAGAYGGSLGYAQRTFGSTVAGINGGFVGIGFDEFGNFSNGNEGRVGGAGFFPNTVAIRGNAGSQYAYLTGYMSGGSAASLPFAIDTPGATLRGTVATRTWRVTLTTSLTIAVAVSLNGGAFQTIVPATDVSRVNGVAFPKNFYFGFASSTGGSTNIHELTSLLVESADVAFGVVNGPVGAPDAKGSYDGTSPVDQNDDFTERSFNQPGATITVGGAFAQPVSGIAVPNQLKNTGNVPDSYVLTATAPTGWTVKLLQDASFPGPGAGGAAQVSSPGAALSGSVDGATSRATTVTIPAGQVLAYWASYTSPAGTKVLQRYDGPIVAASTTSAVASNTTHDELYANFIDVAKSVAIASNCLTTPPAGGVCPGGTLTYSLRYANIALAGGTGNTEPASALLSTKPGSLQIAEDGAQTGNTWATTTTGLRGVPTDTTAGSTFAFGAANGATLTPGDTRFADTVGGASGMLGPGQSGTIAFSLVVR